jgi:hypothetical protein
MRSPEHPPGYRGGTSRQAQPPANLTGSADPGTPTGIVTLASRQALQGSDAGYPSMTNTVSKACAVASPPVHITNDNYLLTMAI